MPEPNTTGEEAAELRRALVRFLVEASLEDTSQAQVADELLQAVRAVPAQNAEQLAGLERRIDKLAAQMEQLSGAVRAGAGSAAGAGRNTRGLLSGIAAGVITGIAAALLTATLLAGSVAGLKARGPEPAALGAHAASESSAADTQVLAVNALAAADAEGAPREAAPAAPRDSTSLDAAWEDIWARMLAAPVSSCAAGGAVALRKCVCPAADEDCTLAQAQSVPGGAVMLAQALIKVRNPPLGRGEEINGRLGPSTVRALVKLTRACGSLGKLAQQLAQDSRGRSGFDADRALEPILIGLSRQPQCVEEP